MAPGPVLGPGAGADADADAGADVVIMYRVLAKPASPCPSSVAAVGESSDYVDGLDGIGY